MLIIGILILYRAVYQANTDRNCVKSLRKYLPWDLTRPQNLLSFEQFPSLCKNHKSLRVSELRLPVKGRQPFFETKTFVHEKNQHSIKE
jgi:hypothetical protein